MATRRRFLRDSTLAVAGAAGLPGVLEARQAVTAPSDRIRVGVIGCNGMGFADLSSIMKVPEVECAALCDVDDEVLNRRAGEADSQIVAGEGGASLSLEDDLRRRDHRHPGPLALPDDGHGLRGR